MFFLIPLTRLVKRKPGLYFTVILNSEAVGNGISAKAVASDAGDIPVLVMPSWVAVRQGLEFAKRKDTTGIDLAYHMAGLLGGGVVGLLL